MEAQAAQQPTRTTYTRPRQPEDSPAAALPTETLIRILELAMEEEDPFERQKLRWTFQKVSCQWSEAAGEQREYAVAAEKQAEALVQAFHKAGRAGKVQSLAINQDMLYGAQGAMVELLKICSALTKLELLRVSRFDFAYGDEEAVEAMLKLKEVQEVVFMGLPEALTLSRILRAWPVLRSLRLSCRFRNETSMLDPMPSVALQHLDIVPDLDMIRELLLYIKDSDLPRSLTVRSGFVAFIRHPPKVQEAQALLPLATRLHRFSAPDGWEPSTEFERLIGAMTSLRHLELGYTTYDSLTAGETKHNLPPATSLQSLASLQELVLRSAGESDSAAALAEISSPIPPVRPGRLELGSLDR
ncbi:hypothetical protein BCR35DRAFT_352223 [Leucosporidium creatinivorum]|uniref:F-box domain-containing protein n=1 Tax=Leucosporidium creatinivorum TaxID=106004 RepID=A0A1Y2FFK5_9BASI|nr:hypothetical protein BCR35DRAFT_352223 [Leucosporidium creatinivorum]